jgi:acylphosphatase
MPTMLRRHFLVSGEVQGVGFRYYVRRRARQLGITGWVRNRHDGCVEAEVQGDSQAVATLERMVRAGPPGSRVDAVEAADRPIIDGEQNFVILVTS